MRRLVTFDIQPGTLAAYLLRCASAEPEHLSVLRVEVVERAGREYHRESINQAAQLLTHEGCLRRAEPGYYALTRLGEDYLDRLHALEHPCTSTTSDSSNKDAPCCAAPSTPAPACSPMTNLPSSTTAA